MRPLGGDGSAGAGLAYSGKGTSAGWEAELRLRFAARGGRTVLVERCHRGPLVVQKSLHPEGEAICHAIVVHPPGGIAGGDHLSLMARIDDDAHALLTTPGAGKWYKANGRRAQQDLQFSVAADAVLEWLPQETILFDAADVVLHTQVELAADARYAGWEILCLGRRAAGERFERGRLRQRLQIKREGRRLWGEYGDVRAGDALLSSPVGMSGRTVTAAFVVAAGTLPAELLERCRTAAPADGAAHGVTALPEIFAARYLGDSAQAARHYFETIWAVLRPWYAGAPMQRPRIWNT